MRRIDDQLVPPSAARPTRVRIALLGMTVALATVLAPMPARAGSPITAQWVIDENAKPGTTDWKIPSDAPTDIEGYADHVSAQVGDQVRLYVSTTASTFHVVAYRIGWYEGDGGRAIWTSDEVAGVDQPAPKMDKETRMVEARWGPSLTITIDPAWVQGNYLVKLVSSDGGQGYLPLVVRDDASTARIVIQEPVTTWEAYNDWGGASLYVGPSGGFDDHATEVSFDRPYAQTRGAGRLLSDLPLISLVESQGLDVTYWTDLDLHARPGLLKQHQTLVTTTHDEYWSTAMRKGVTKARAAGVNLAFFGGNDVYWHIRVEDSPRGPDRRIVCYKSKADPLFGVKDSEVTVRWRQKPLSDPESSLLGSMYGCSGVVEQAFAVADAGAWVFAGTSMKNGDTIPIVESSEVDWVHPSKPTPGNLQVLGHSPISCGDGSKRYSDMTYYTASSDAGVFNAASIGWLDGTRCAAPVKDSRCDPRAVTITLNVIEAFAEAPAGIAHPAVPNTESFGYHLTHPTVP